MKISIVMTYHDRMRQLHNTLRSLRMSQFKDFEVIIVDDATPNLGLYEVCRQYEDMDITTIRVEPEKKWWINPCIPYNMGLKEAVGDIIVIQNPECIHYGGDILSHVNTTLKPGEYQSFPCYSTTQEQWTACFSDLIDSSDALFTSRIDRHIYPFRQDQWYNHPGFHPKGYHFCSAIHQEDLEKIGGGFEEGFAHGYCFDDDEFIQRIRNSHMHVTLLNPIMGFVVHQWHTKNPLYQGACPEWHKNLALLNHIRAVRGWK